MSILKLKPSCKDYLWGGHRLVDEYGKEYDGDVLAETWELSCHPDGPSTIVNGPGPEKHCPSILRRQEARCWAPTAEGSGIFRF